MIAATQAEAHTSFLVISFSLLGLLLLTLGFWGRGREEGLMVDTKLGDRLDPDDREYRVNNLRQGVAAMFLLGVIFLAVALALYIWAP